MKRITVIVVAILLLAALGYRFIPVLRARPAAVPADAAPCWFGLSLRWVSIGPPHLRELVDGGVVQVYDSSGNVVERAVVALAKPPQRLDMTQSRGYVPYPHSVLRGYELPRGRTLSAQGSRNEPVIDLDSRHALVPWWSFK